MGNYSSKLLEYKEKADRFQDTKDEKLLDVLGPELDELWSTFTVEEKAAYADLLWESDGNQLEKEVNDELF